VLHAEDSKPVDVNVTGTWKAKVEVAGQTGEPTFALKQDGDKITGRYAGSFGEEEVTGRIAGDEFEFEFILDQGTVTYSGTIDGDSIKGEVKYGDLPGTWTAEREKAKQEKEKEDAKNSNGDVQTGSIQKATFEYAVKNSQKLFLDRFVDTSANIVAKRPVIIFSIGGGWENGGRGDGDVPPLFKYLASLGYTMVSIDYRPGIKIAKASGEMTKENGTEMYLRAIQWGVEDLFDATSC
jgi:hypothetical protein